MSTRETEATPWQWANDSPVWLKPRRTVYFLVRHVGDNHEDWTTGTVEYREDKRGRLIMYSSREQAIRMQDKLNAKELMQ